MKVSIAIATFDKDSLGHKEGDIIAVRPAGWQWGIEERKRYLILEIDLGTEIKTIEEAQKLTVPQFDTEELWWPSDTLPRPAIVNKRRYKVPFLDMITLAQSIGITLDLLKIKDQDVVYQPLEQITLLFNLLLYDKVFTRKLTIDDLAAIAVIGVYA